MPRLQVTTTDTKKEDVKRTKDKADSNSSVSWSSQSESGTFSYSTQDTFTTASLDLYLDKTTKERIRNVLVLLIALLIIENVALIAAFFSLAQLQYKAAVLEATLKPQTVMATSSKFNKLDGSVQALESTINTRHIGLDMVNELRSQVTANISMLQLNVVELQSITAANLTKLANKLFAHSVSISNMISSNLSLSDQVIANTTRHIGLTLPTVVSNLLTSIDHPFSSCAAVRQFRPFSPSGNYRITSSKGSISNVYCDMARTYQGNTGGWMRVVELDFTDTSVACPGNTRLLLLRGHRVCTPQATTATCASISFSLHGIEYSKVYGRIRGFQKGTTGAFAASVSNPDINTYYVDGVSLTHGSPRQHIWTFAIANSQNDENPLGKCPCTNIDVASMVPPIPTFVGQDYFCDSGTTTNPNSLEFYDAHPIWDGLGCGAKSTCCSFNNPPWFLRQLPQPTTDDIEMRLCRSDNSRIEDVYIELVEIYVQ